MNIIRGGIPPLIIYFYANFKKYKKIIIEMERKRNIMLKTKMKLGNIVYAPQKGGAWGSHYEFNVRKCTVVGMMLETWQNEVTYYLEYDGKRVEKKEGDLLDTQPLGKLCYTKKELMSWLKNAREEIIQLGKNYKMLVDANLKNTIETYARVNISLPQDSRIETVGFTAEFFRLGEIKKDIEPVIYWMYSTASYDESKEEPLLWYKNDLEHMIKTGEVCILRNEKDFRKMLNLKINRLYNILSGK